MATTQLGRALLADLSANARTEVSLRTRSGQFKGVHGTAVEVGDVGIVVIGSKKSQPVSVQWILLRCFYVNHLISIHKLLPVVRLPSIVLRIGYEIEVSRVVGRRQCASISLGTAHTALIHLSGMQKRSAVAH